METILLLGDSLTQQGYLSNWVSRLSNYFIRRAHVINSGLSGYNTRWLVTALRDETMRNSVFPPFVQRPLFVTLFFGANDLARNEQNVPLAEYKANLKAIITDVIDNVKPKAGVFVFTPPPVDGPAWQAAENLSVSNRFFEDTRAYRAAVLEVVSECQGLAAPVVLVDVHTAVLQYGRPQLDLSVEPTFDPKDPWTGLLVDGLHVGEVGGALFFSTLLEALRHSPRADLLSIDNIPEPLPEWEEMCARHSKK